MKRIVLYLIALVAFPTLVPRALIAQSETREFKIGIIASLTGIAANYGSSVVEGARLAVKELNLEDSKVKYILVVEDDRSDPKAVVTGYRKLSSIDKIDALIGGTWWANGIVKTVEKSGIPFISCQTLFNKEFIRADNYFSIAGDLRDWIRVFEPEIKKRNLNQAVIVRFTSGFADTLESELNALFSAPRKFIGSLVYSDIHFSEASSIVLKLKSMHPEVVYFDGQPASLATFLRRALEAQLDQVVILTNEIFDDTLSQKLVDVQSLKSEVYFTKRAEFDENFKNSFLSEYSKPPYLQADLGYLAVKALAQAVRNRKPLEFLKSGELELFGRKVNFDENNVLTAVPQELWVARGGKIEKVVK